MSEYELKFQKMLKIINSKKYDFGERQSWEKDFENGVNNFFDDIYKFFSTEKKNTENFSEILL